MDAVRFSEGCRDGGEGFANKRVHGEYLHVKGDERVWDEEGEGERKRTWMGRIRLVPR